MTSSEKKSRVRINLRDTGTKTEPTQPPATSRVRINLTGRRK